MTARKLLVLFIFLAPVIFLAAFFYRENSTSLSAEVATQDEKRPSLFQSLLHTASRSGILPDEPIVEILPPVQQPGRSASLPGARWIPQSFNNCAPATTSMLLQFFGHEVSQVETKSALRTNPEDKNVFTPEIQKYLKEAYGLDSKLGFGGDLVLLKTLFANGFYVMVEDWLYPHDDVGHNTIIRGFDDDRRVFISDDAYIGAGVTFSYDAFLNDQWKGFNREYLVVYTKDREPLLRAILGKYWDDSAMWQRAAEVAQAEIDRNSGDMQAWFNLGSSYFGQGKYAEAKQAYERARALGWPKRMLWYQIQPIQTYNQLGEYEKALELIAEGLSGNQEYAELHYEAAVAYRGLGQLDRARNSVNLALRYAPAYEPAVMLSKEL